jgi:dolichol-phosphate mannosyltransferase
MRNPAKLAGAPAPFPGVLQPSVTVVVPTYQEAQNIPHLIERVREVREAAGLDLELLLMDDRSGDGSAELVERIALPWVRLIERTGKRGLSEAVLEGLRRSRRDVLVVMDGDLSHPPEEIPRMLRALGEGADVVFGSRFTEGGSTDDDWSLFRRINSRVATLLALPLVRMKDPMSGFFAMRRATFEAGRDFSPVGYKIGLEVVIKCRCRRIVEVPIHFTDRQRGRSKLSMAEQLNYLKHIRRLYDYRFGTWSHLGQFLVVGASGLVVNLLLLTLLLWLGAEKGPAVASSIALSMLWNFGLNRRFSFSYARTEAVLPQLVGFVAACSVGAVVNYVITTAIWDAVRIKQVAAIAGVVAGTGLNFVTNRFVVFRRTRAWEKPAAARPGGSGR